MIYSNMHTQGCATADPGLQSRHPIRGTAKSLKYSYSKYELLLLQLSHPGVKICAVWRKIGL